MTPNAKIPFLRDQLIYGRSWYYYFAIANNFVMRLVWVTSLSMGTSVSQSVSHLQLVSQSDISYSVSRL